MSYYFCNSLHSNRYSSADQKIVPSGDLIQPLVPLEAMWTFRQTTLVAISALTIVAVMLVTKTSRGQTVSEASHSSATPSTANLPMCDIKSATQKTDALQWKNRNLSHLSQPLAPGAPTPAPSDPASSEASSTKDHLRLSLPGASGKQPIQEGAFCRRPDQDAQNPSTTSPAQNEPPQQPPIAQNTGGQLLIHANGQDFSAVLRAVGTASGIDIEMPAENAADPVFMNMGPVSAKEAIVALMDGTKYNYVMMGSRNDPGIVTRLILSERSSTLVGAPLVAAVSEAVPGSQPTLYGGQGVQEDTDAANNAVLPPAQGPGSIPAVVPSSVPTGINVDKLAAQSNKTRGQVLDELQKQQLQVLDNQSSSQPPQ
jgi:hypothetical protein